MAKQKHSDFTEETILCTINRLVALNKPRGTQIAQNLRCLIPDILSAEKKGAVTTPAREFTVDETVHVFKLNYTEMPFNNQHSWRIEDSELGFMMTPYLVPVLENYSKNFDRSSEAICRTALDLILNECLTVMKGNHFNPAAKTTSDKRTPTLFDGLRVFGHLAFNHEVTLQSKISPTSPRRLLVSGRLDYGIGRVSHYRAERRFQCALVIVTAKVQSCVRLAVPELLVYLACLRQSRLECNRTDASVYGVASDGYQFIFVTIAHDGTVKTSNMFDIFTGDLLKVLGWLKFILEKTAVLSPNASGGDGQDFDDPSIDFDDNNYTNPPEEEEED